MSDNALIATALVLSGFQNDFCHPQGSMATSSRGTSVVDAVVAAHRLLTAARHSRIPVFHVQERRLPVGLSDSLAWRSQRAFNRWPEDLVQPGTWGEEFVGELEPVVGEVVVERFRPGCLSDTRLEILLRSEGIRRLVIAGVETHRTVLATVIQAVCLDFEVALAREAVASCDVVRGEAGLEVLSSWATILSLEDLVYDLAQLSMANGGS